MVALRRKSQQEVTVALRGKLLQEAMVASRGKSQQKVILRSRDSLTVAQLIDWTSLFQRKTSISHPHSPLNSRERV